jgi:malonate-semialdehyde dehydrogenase (acetylating)/methylmalonate-semialdehyde dehydrogenase
MSNTPKKLKYYVDGQWHESKTEKYMECFNPSTGEVTALAPQCTQEEVNAAIVPRSFSG